MGSPKTKYLESKNKRLKFKDQDQILGQNQQKGIKNIILVKIVTRKLLSRTSTNV